MRDLGSLLRRGVLFELRLYVSLARWLVRRPATGGPGQQPVGYARASTPVIWLWIFASALEVPLVHVLVPWDPARIALLALSIWGLLWMVGFLASLHVYPHLLDDDGLRLRSGPSTWVTVPWTAVASVVARRTDLPSSMRTLQELEAESGTVLHVAVSGTTNVQAVLREPTTVLTSKGPREVVAVGFMADDPQELVRGVRDARRPAGRPGSSTRTIAGREPADERGP